MKKSVWLILMCWTFHIQAAASVSVNEGYIRGLPPGQLITAAFMRLQNDGDEPVVVTSAQSTVAERAEFHGHVHSGGMMSMKRVASITIPAKGEFVLKPGDHHLMLINLTRFLKDGDSADLTLYFKGGEQLTVTLPVRSVLNEHKH